MLHQIISKKTCQGIFTNHSLFPCCQSHLLALACSIMKEIICQFVRCKELQKIREATYCILGATSSYLEDLKFSRYSYVGICTESNLCREISVFVTLKDNITQIRYSSIASVHREMIAIENLDFHLQPIVDQCQ